MSAKHIRFRLIKRKTKTNVYSVRNKESGVLLGKIEWYGSWRKYCFFPSDDTVYDRRCMRDINNFINKLMNDR